ncbi:hypothetical protein [Haloterrigena alkaliphila]|uniref:Small CPxCG-related zinc finger protein n=1 Tax=Haloterrigena alkaliphila TaxID=2816475 RepID=A0A8A2VBZ6_9EURY|nr:hypothetical protein [Haloterrigena alkaliphila]QSW98240.1 hypothetical protein J0X25_12615 [Haloterrigena alkaliphila]
MGDDREQQLVTACPECGDDGSVKQTVPWQPNICTSCGSDIPKSDD